MFPRTRAGANSSPLQVRAPMDSSGIESVLLHTAKPLVVFDRCAIYAVPLFLLANLFRS
jgi:hypothetical protein